MDNKLYQKTIIWNGDSICAGTKDTAHWADRIAQRNAADLKTMLLAAVQLRRGCRL